MNHLKQFVIGIFIVILTYTLVAGIGSTIETNLPTTQKIQSVNVFFTEEGTTATEFKVAIYDDTGRLIKTSEAGEVLGGSWCTVNFKYPVTIEDKAQYSFLVSADGAFSIPGDEEEGYLSEEIDSYADFPKTISNSGDGKLSIYASYI